MTHEHGTEFDAYVNRYGRLSKITASRVQAASFSEAEVKADRELQGFLSQISLRLNIPITIGKTVIVEAATHNTQLEILMPFWGRDLEILRVSKHQTTIKRAGQIDSQSPRGPSSAVRPVKSRSRQLDGKRLYTTNLCRFLRSARNDARRLPMALLSHTGGPNARAPGWAAVVALDGHSRTEVRQFRSKKRILPRR
jgi:hypothetical protein